MEAIVTFLANILAIMAALICLVAAVPILMGAIYVAWCIVSSTIRDCFKEKGGCK